MDGERVTPCWIYYLHRNCRYFTLKLVSTRRVKPRRDLLVHAIHVHTSSTCCVSSNTYCHEVLLLVSLLNPTLYSDTQWVAEEYLPRPCIIIPAMDFGEPRSTCSHMSVSSSLAHQPPNDVVVRVIPCCCAYWSDGRFNRPCLARSPPAKVDDVTCMSLIWPSSIPSRYGYLQILGVSVDMKKKTSRWT